MEKENKRKIIMIASLVFVALAFAGNIYALIDLIISNETPAIIKGGSIVDRSFTCIALITSILYISAGFKKTSAKYFKFFLYTSILSLLIRLFTLVIIIKASIFLILGIFIVFVLLNVLFGTKDLGKKTSLILSYIILACVILVVIISVFTPNYNIKKLFWNLADISLAVVLIVMMLLKYYDKALRNTK